MNQPNERSYNFVKAIEFTLPWETGKDKSGKLRADGGLHYRDENLPTKYGIWQKANPEVDVVNLTVDGAIDIYQTKYWDIYFKQREPANLNGMAPGFAVSVFDCGVNCGVGFGYSFLLKALKTKDPAKTVNDLRGARYFDLKTANFKKYGPSYNGWMNRLNDLRKYVEILAVSNR